MTMQSLINIDGNGLKDVLIDLNDKLATAVGWIANKETPEKIAINTYIKAQTRFLRMELRSVKSAVWVSPQNCKVLRSAPDFNEPCDLNLD